MAEAELLGLRRRQSGPAVVGKAQRNPAEIRWTRAQIIRKAAHEVRRLVFYAIAIIITAYLPILSLKAVEGRLFHRMAWTVAFALLGALTFSIVTAPVLSSLPFGREVKEWHNPVMIFLADRYRRLLRLSIVHRRITVGLAALGLALVLATSGIIGRSRTHQG